MALCKHNKYSLDELQKFTDRIENVLTHDVCREEFRSFLKDNKGHDLIIVLEIWEMANDIRRNTPGSPERKRKSQALETRIENEPSFSVLIGDDTNIVAAVNERASEKLRKYHRFYVHYLTRKYRQFVNL